MLGNTEGGKRHRLGNMEGRGTDQVTRKEGKKEEGQGGSLGEERDRPGHTRRRSR